MDRYLVTDTLESGPQGATYVVRDRINNKTYALKKIECNDDPEAHKARREVMRLAKLKHRHLALPRDAFVHWDAHEQAVYLCIVSDFFVTGDLKSYLEESSRKQHSHIEVNLQRWIGQLLHALIYLHDNGIAHTNLKPSNVYLTPELDLCIGDFGIRAVQEDLHRFRARTRAVVWALVWAPPEVFEVPHDSKTDVWALGCLLFELASLSHQDVFKSRDALLSLRASEDHSAYMDSLKQIGLSFDNSKEMCECIMRLLAMDPDARPSMRDTMKMAYTRQCIDIVTHS